MKKEEYREYFRGLKKYVRYAPILEELGMQKANFSQFLSGSNTNAISTEKLEMIKQRIEEVFNDFDYKEER